MIIWLASYPRSGNTMFRMMLNKVFGCKTYTKYFSVNQPHNRNEDIRKPTGQTPLPGPWAECYRPFSESSETHLVKTHDGPDDDAKAIYVVRNGFASIRSYKSYLRDFNNQDCSLEQIILGQPQFRSWGWHLDAWNPLKRPNTLLLKYEDLVERPDAEIQRVLEFTGFTKQAEWVNEFDKFHASNPKMFRQGHGGDPQGDFTEAEQQLFWAVHGDWMLALGYCAEVPSPGVTHRTLRQVVSDRMQAQPPAVVATNGHDTDGDYKRLKKHWWTKLGRKVGAVRESTPSDKM